MGRRGKWKPTTKKRGTGKPRDRGAKIPNKRLPRELDITVEPLTDDDKRISSFVVPYGIHRGKTLLSLNLFELYALLGAWNTPTQSHAIANIEAEIERRENRSYRNGVYVLTFGKNRGKTIRDVDDDYLFWGIENLTYKRPLAEMHVELERRGLAEPLDDSLSQEYRAIVGEPDVNYVRRANHRVDSSIQAPWE